MVIDAEKARELLAELGDNVTLIDVRHEHEYAVSRIKGAILIDNDEISEKTVHPKLPQDKKRPLIVYCRSGVRSNIAMKKLQALGYETVYDMGGILDWPFGVER